MWLSFLFITIQILWLITWLNNIIRFSWCTLIYIFVLFATIWIWCLCSHIFFIYHYFHEHLMLLLIVHLPYLLTLTLKIPLIYHYLLLVFPLFKSLFVISHWFYLEFHPCFSLQRLPLSVTFHSQALLHLVNLIFVD